MSHEPLVVTGVGVVTPLGLEAGSLCDALSRVSPATTAARVGELPAADFLPAGQIRRMDRLSRMIGIAAVSAVRAAGAEGEIAEPAIVVGSALGNLSESATFLERVFRRPALASPMLFPNLVLNAPAGQLATALGWRGPNLAVAAGEVSGESALATAARLLRNGRARLALVAAGDELADVAGRLLAKLGAVAPEKASSRPFDRRAAGPILGEGAAAVVVETQSSARDRGARALAVLDRVEQSVLPALPFRWPRPPVAPLTDLGGVDVVFSGADSSHPRDQLEAALLDGFGGHVTTWKGGLGEFGSAGLLGVALAIESRRAKRVPPAVGLEEPVPSALRFVREPLSERWRRAVVLGVARGGAVHAVRLSEPT